MKFTQWIDEPNVLTECARRAKVVAGDSWEDAAQTAYAGMLKASYKNKEKLLADFQCKAWNARQVELRYRNRSPIMQTQITHGNTDIDKQLLKLPEKLYLVARYLAYGETMETTAEELNISLSTVQRRKAQIKEELS